MGQDNKNYVCWFENAMHHSYVVVDIPTASVLQQCHYNYKAAITWIRYDYGWPSVIRNVSVKETHGTCYTAANPVRQTLIDCHVFF